MNIDQTRINELRQDFEKVLKVLENCDSIEKALSVPKAEFQRRQNSTWSRLDPLGIDVGFVFSDEHYNGDVPYLGGNTNITIEQVAGAIRLYPYRYPAIDRVFYLKRADRFGFGHHSHPVRLPVHARRRSDPETDRSDSAEDQSGRHRPRADHHV